MSSYLIIDGYNLIHKWPNLIKAQQKSMEFARNQLFYAIQRYCDYNHIHGIIAYDGKGSERSIEEGNPQVIFSKAKESADTVIESIVYNLKDRSCVSVATDDRVVANLVTGMGACIISSTLLAGTVFKDLPLSRKDVEIH